MNRTHRPGLRQNKPDTPLFRTRHLNQDGSPVFSNQLIHETSPYLLQHAHNPVDWFPWGEEALSLAKKRNTPLFVSIGYATCHWCHVMEEESFEDLEIAEYLNEHFVCVKVDREERPDLDAIYMSAVQILNGNGGWPLNVFLTPRGMPFVGGTYFPARDGDRGPSTGFLTLIRRIRDVFHTKSEAVESTSRQLTQAIRRMLAPPAGRSVPGPLVLEKATALFRQIFDPNHGGIQGAPKFPSSLPVRFLLRRGQRTSGAECLGMARTTLDRMARGGIYDQIGGGFHRYSTDETWLVPHFEKMLYDNALLAMAYLKAFEITGDETYRRITEETLRYITVEMRSPEGLFFSATDADSLSETGEKEEGLFFTWTPEEIDACLPENLSNLAKTCWSIQGSPHFEGRFIPHQRFSDQELADRNNLTLREFRENIGEIKAALYQERLKREPPLTDTKILTAWNGLMISAFAQAGNILKNPEFTEVAVRAAEGLISRVFSDGRLYRTFQEGKPRHRGCLDDHAFLGQAFLDLHDTTSDDRWLEKALEIDRILETYFEDRENGGFFMTASDHEALIAREKPSHDQATPSGNSVSAMNLLRLYDKTGETAFLERAEKTFRAFAEALKQNPHAFGDMLLALDMYHGHKDGPVGMSTGPQH